MNKIYILFTLTMTLVFYSCSDNYNNITQTEVEEWQVYINKQNLVFTDKFGTDQSFKVNPILAGYTQSGDTYNEFISDVITMADDSISRNSLGYLRMFKNGGDLEVTFRWPHHNNTFPVTLSKPKGKYVLNGDTILNVYISAVPFSKTDSTHSYIDSVFYQKQLGFFRYTDIYNNTWTKTN